MGLYAAIIVKDTDKTVRLARRIETEASMLAFIAENIKKDRDLKQTVTGLIKADESLYPEHWKEDTQCFTGVWVHFVSKNNIINAENLFADYSIKRKCDLMRGAEHTLEYEEPENYDGGSGDGEAYVIDTSQKTLTIYWGDEATLDSILDGPSHPYSSYCRDCDEPSVGLDSGNVYINESLQKIRGEGYLVGALY